MPRGRPVQNKQIKTVSSDEETEEEVEVEVKQEPKKAVAEVVSSVVQASVENQKVPTKTELKEALKEEGVNALTKKDLDAILEQIESKISRLVEAQENYFTKIQKEVKKNHLDTQIKQSREQLDHYFKFR